MSGRLQDQKITLVTYYAPNKKHLPFLSHVFALLKAHGTGFLI